MVDSLAQTRRIGLAPTSTRLPQIWSKADGTLFADSSPNAPSFYRPSRLTPGRSGSSTVWRRQHCQAFRGSPLFGGRVRTGCANERGRALRVGLPTLGRHKSLGDFGGKQLRPESKSGRMLPEA